MSATTIKIAQVTFSTDADVNAKRLTNVATPTADTDAATKLYVDNVAAGHRDPKDAVRAATTANITLSGAQTIDGVSVVAGDRVLVKDQTDDTENGIWIAASGSWARATDADDDGEITFGTSVLVVEGTANAGRTYLVSSADPIAIGTDSITWIQTAAASTNFAESETPSGTINGSNTAFTLASSPIAGSVKLYYNGVRLEAGAGNDYTISGASITMLFAPETGSKLLADYRY